MIFLKAIKTIPTVFWNETIKNSDSGGWGTFKVLYYKKPRVILYKKDLIDTLKLFLCLF